MSVHSRHRSRFLAARLRRILRESGDTRTFVIVEEPDERYVDEPFVLRCSVGVGSDVPVARDEWPGMDLGPQDVHGGNEAA